MRPLVLLDAAPFCFGPVSTLQVVVDELLDSDLGLRLLTSGTTAEFMTGYDPRFEEALLVVDLHSDSKPLLLVGNEGYGYVPISPVAADLEPVLFQSPAMGALPTLYAATQDLPGGPQ